MASPDFIDKDSASIDPAAPFRGIIVCCTSIPPEHRTEIAQKTADLGGVHKYDLTPDVTHLVVGHYDTPKYRHVARERPDIMVMDPFWIEAVSELWRNDDEIDFRALEKEYQLKPLEASGADITSSTEQPGPREALLICLTGFGDQRVEIANTISANGGRFTADLTRKCTHLIVHKPEGKKFTAAKSWGVRTITLSWLLQSVERGMILEETKFDPLLPLEEQGVDAWVKKDARSVSMAKRSRSSVSNAPEDGPRKLRKTASMKLNSQRNRIWSDLLGRSTSRDYSFSREEQDAEAPAPEEPQPTVPVPPMEECGIFSGCLFYIHGFSQTRTAVLKDTIAKMDGTISDTIQQISLSTSPSGHPYRFLIVPQNSQPDSHPQLADSDVNFVTEFYVEQCLHNKRFTHPAEQTLGRPFPLFPIPGFSHLTICSAAFTGLELNQVARSVGQLGANFDGEFRKTTNILICKSLQVMRKDKLRYALEWKVPVVSAEWLWDCISAGFKIPIDEYIYPEIKSYYTSAGQSVAVEERQQHGKTSNSESPTDGNGKGENKATKPTATILDDGAFNHGPQAVEKKTSRKDIFQEESTTSADFMTAQSRPADTNSRDSDAPLSELSSTSLNKSPSPPKHRIIATSAIGQMKSEPQSKSGINISAAPEREASASLLEPGKQKDGDARSQTRFADRQALTSKITTLIDSGAAATETSDAPHGPSRLRKRQILGRAVSNVSNGSNNSVDVTRASHGPHKSVEAAAAVGDTFADGGDADNQQESDQPSTQLEYSDPAAQKRKAALMSMMRGDAAAQSDTNKVLDSESVGPAATARVVPSPPAGMGEVSGVSIVGGRSLRRR